MADLIQPRTLKGFRDYPPALMIPREWLVDTARRVYRSYGFAPIETPRFHGAWCLVVEGKRMTGTLRRLPDNAVVRRVEVTRDEARPASGRPGRIVPRRDVAVPEHSEGWLAPTLTKV